MSYQINYVWIWSIHHPEYNARIAAMSHPANIHNAFEDANYLFLVPKE